MCYFAVVFRLALAVMPSGGVLWLFEFLAERYLARALDYIEGLGMGFYLLVAGALVLFFLWLTEPPPGRGEGGRLPWPRIGLPQLWPRQWRGRRMPLREAMRWAYDAAPRNLHTLMAERFARGSEEALLAHLAILVVRNSSDRPLRLWGRKPVGRAVREIPEAEIMSGRFLDGGSALAVHSSEQPDWVDLEVRRSDVRGWIARQG